MTAVRAVRAGRRLLLTLAAAAAEAGVGTEAVRNWAAMGLLTAEDTPVGTRYDRAAIRALLADAWQAPAAAPELLTPQQVSRALHVGVPVISQKADEGRMTCVRTVTGRRRYVAAEVRAIAAERERLCDPQWWPPAPKPSRKPR